MKVAIADDSTLFRAGLATLLQAQGVTVTVQAPSGAELVASTASDPPDVVVLDVRMWPTFTDEGIQTAAALRARDPALPVLVLSTYAETSFAVRLLELGSSGLGYLLKDRVASVSTLVDALSRLTAGESVVDAEIIARLLSHQRSRNVLARLTERELQVLTLMGEGHSNAGIGHKLYLSPRTVEANIAAIFHKLDLSTNADDNRRVLAVLAFLRHGGP